MAVWSVVCRQELFKGFDLAGEHYHPEKLQALELLNYGRGKKLKELVQAIRDVVSPEDTMKKTVGIYDLGAAHGHILQACDAHPEERVSTKKIAIKGDVLVSRLRSYLRQVAYIPNSVREAHVSTEFIVLRSNEGNGAWVVPFVLSGLIQKILKWSQDGSEHPRFSEDVLLDLMVPVSILQLKDALNKYVRRAIAHAEKSRELYSEAERMLLGELGLLGLDLSTVKFCERRFSEVKSANRLDSEFFQPKYDRLLKRLKRAARNLAGNTIGNLSDPLKYGTSDKLTYVDEGVPFLRIADLYGRRFEMSSILHIPDEEASLQKSARVKMDDVLVSRSGTLGLGVAIPKELHNAVFGSYFIRLRPDKEQVNPEYLAFYINALCGETQVERVNTGCIQTNLTIPAIKSIFVVFGDKKWQERYVEILGQSVAERKESRRLLEEAIRLVEDRVLKGTK